MMNEHRGLSMRAIALVLLASASASAEIVVVPNGVTPGPLNVTGSMTLTLPPDGRLYFTTINISGNLFFTKNALNTPVYLLATGDVFVNGTIHVEGGDATGMSPPVGAAGGPGGFNGGEPAFGSLPGGAGHGPGGGTPPFGQGSHVTGLSPYGTALTLPLIGGSGGAGGGPGGGGGGGGAIVVASNTSITLAGPSHVPAVNASGGNGNNSGGGSGGTVRLVAPRVAGTGYLYLHGANGNASPGRCRVDALDRRGLQIVCAANYPYYFGQPSLFVGSMLQIEPAVMPRLDLLEVAGQPVPGGSAFNIILPTGSASTQPVRIRAQDFFSGSARASVRVTPASGAATVLAPVDIANNTEVVVDVPIPANNTVTIEVYGEEAGGA
jgi:hypothetical protein